jgi:hypothetical protein
VPSSWLLLAWPPQVTSAVEWLLHGACAVMPVWAAGLDAATLERQLSSLLASTSLGTTSLLYGQIATARHTQEHGDPQVRHGREGRAGARLLQTLLRLR